MKQSVYIETSVVSYLTARPSRDVRAAAWQQITTQWWEEDRTSYDLFVSELVVTESSSGNLEAAAKRLEILEQIPKLLIDGQVQGLAMQLIFEKGVPATAEADALHIAVAAVQNIDFLLTWNFRHIDNAATKPLIRSICAAAGFVCPEICTPIELIANSEDDV